MVDDVSRPEELLITAGLAVASETRLLPLLLNDNRSTMIVSVRLPLTVIFNWALGA